MPWSFCEIRTNGAALFSQLIDRVAISCLFLRFVHIFKSNVLQNINVLISKKCAYFRLLCLYFLRYRSAFFKLESADYS